MSQKRTPQELPAYSPQPRFNQTEEPLYRVFQRDPNTANSECNFPEKQKLKYAKLNCLQDSYQDDSFLDAAQQTNGWKVNKVSGESPKILPPPKYQSNGFQQDAKEAYQKMVPTRFRAPDRSESISQLKIRLFFQTRQGKQTILFRLTRDDQVQYIKILEMCEADFQQLRSEQSLRVDYLQFPKKIFELLDLCCNSFEKEGDHVVFTCIVENQTNGQAVFRIVEQNEFKELDHLILNFSQPDDTIVKNYLADCLLMSRNNEAESCSKIDKLEAKLAAKEKEISEQIEHIHALQTELKDNKLSFAARLQEKQNEIESHFLTQMKLELEEKERLKKTFQETIAQMEEGHKTKIEQLTTRLDAAMSGSIEASGKGREYQTRLSVLETEHQTTLESLKAAKIGYREKEARVFELEKELTELKFSFSVLDRSVKDKEEAKLQQQETNKVLSQSLSKQDEMLQDFRKQVEKLETKLLKSAKEIEKANEILESYEADNKRRKAQVKELKVIIMQQEKTINQAADAQNQLKNEATIMSKNLIAKEALCKELEAQGKANEVKIAELTRQIEKNALLMDHLNEKLNEQSRPFISSMRTAMQFSEGLTTTYGGAASSLPFTQKLSSTGQNLLSGENLAGTIRPAESETRSVPHEYDFLLRATSPSPKDTAVKRTAADSDADWTKSLQTGGVSRTVPQNQQLESDIFKANDISSNSIYSGAKLTKTIKTAQQDTYKSFGLADTKEFRALEEDASFDQPQKPNMMPTTINPIRFRAPAPSK